MKLTLKKIDLTFQSDGHIHLMEGKPVPGCSTISAMFDRGDWRCAWASKMAVESIKVWSKDGQMDELDKALVIAKNAWRQTRDRRGQEGTNLHEILEDYIKAKIAGNPSAPFMVPPEFEPQVEDFLTWENQNKVEWLASEIQVGSLKHKYAGIADIVYRIGDKVFLDDFKTSKDTHKEWFIQLVGLKYALEEMGQMVDGIGIFHLPKGGRFARIPLWGHYEREFQAFLVAKDFYKERCLFDGRYGNNGYKGAS